MAPLDPARILSLLAFDPKDPLGFRQRDFPAFRPGPVGRLPARRPDAPRPGPDPARVFPLLRLQDKRRICDPAWRFPRLADFFIGRALGREPAKKAGPALFWAGSPPTWPSWRPSSTPGIGCPAGAWRLAGRPGGHFLLHFPEDQLPRRRPPEESRTRRPGFDEFLLYTAFFPRFTAGPIVRTGEFGPDLTGPTPRTASTWGRPCSSS